LEAQQNERPYRAPPTLQHGMSFLLCLFQTYIIVYAFILIFLGSDIEETGLLSIQIFAQHVFRQDELIGEVKTPIEIGLDFDGIKSSFLLVF
jgi:hypothetical protein